MNRHSWQSEIGREIFGRAYRKDPKNWLFDCTKFGMEALRGWQEFRVSLEHTWSISVSWKSGNSQVHKEQEKRCVGVEKLVNTVASSNWPSRDRSWNVIYRKDLDLTTSVTQFQMFNKAYQVVWTSQAIQALPLMLIAPQLPCWTFHPPATRLRRWEYKK